MKTIFFNTGKGFTLNEALDPYDFKYEVTFIENGREVEAIVASTEEMNEKDVTVFIMESRPLATVVSIEEY